MTDLVEVGRSKILADARQQMLVLAAVGIECHLMRADRDVGLYVASTDVEKAVQELACYERENQSSRQRPLPARPARHAVDAALAYCAVLLFFFGAERRHALSMNWAATGAAQADLIRDGAWWRTITALSLHADPLHLLSNLASGVIFGIFVAHILGSGLAWLAILMAGALGNALIALVQAPEHTAIGASTGIFGALGILSGYTRRSRVVPWRGGLRRWAPLAGGVMLLVFLGFSGERTDIGAHVAGFATGGVMGFILAPPANRLKNDRCVQCVSGALACGLFFLAWLLALHSAG
jgi:membrane associated rhomboid family serine protease